MEQQQILQIAMPDILSLAIGNKTLSQTRLQRAGSCSEIGQNEDSENFKFAFTLVCKPNKKQCKDK